ncbi:MAG: hypothetical protein IKE35_03990 [Lachnospiraceae bacterium]|nr:hypothetical protein [Lachnospiraceae bacterium]
MKTVADLKNFYLKFPTALTMPVKISCLLPEGQQVLLPVTGTKYIKNKDKTSILQLDTGGKHAVSGAILSGLIETIPDTAELSYGDCAAELFSIRKFLIDTDDIIFVCNRGIDPAFPYEDLKDIVSVDGSYVIPVEWTVRSTLKVNNARSLQDALDMISQVAEDIPTGNDKFSFVEGSYRASTELLKDTSSAIEAISIPHTGCNRLIINDAGNIEIL